MGSGCWNGDTRASRSYQAALDCFVDGEEGMGYDHVHPHERLDYPMTRGLVAAAESRRAAVTSDKDARARAVRNTDWMCRHCDRDGDGETGWGLPFRWDTGNEGVVYPAHQETAITTALCIDGLLTTYDCLDNPDRYLTVATDAAATFADGECFTKYNDELCFWYTSAGLSQGDTINSHAMMVGQLQRLSSYDIGESRRRHFRSLADSGVRYLLSERITNREPRGWMWTHYGRTLPEGHTTKQYQDFLHTAYTADGLLTYKEHGGSLADEIDTDKVLAALWNYLAGGGFVRYFGASMARKWLAIRYGAGVARSLAAGNRPVTPQRFIRERKGRYWGLGHSLYVLSRFSGNTDLTDLLLRAIYDERHKLPVQAQQPSVRGAGSARHVAHILNGLSAYLSY